MRISIYKEILSFKYSQSLLQEKKNNNQSLFETHDWIHKTHSRVIECRFSYSSDP